MLPPFLSCPIDGRFVGLGGRDRLVNYFCERSDEQAARPAKCGWNVELDRQVTSGLTVRAGYQARNTTRDFVLNPEAAPAFSPCRTRVKLVSQVQFSGQYRGKRGTLNVSYVRSKAYGD